MLVTLVGMLTLVNPEQLAKAKSPMLVTPSGISIFITFILSLKAWLPIVVITISS